MNSLLELNATNFRSWKSLDLKDLDKIGLCLITGVNGSGKSSIRHLIEYLLLDTTSDNIPLDEIPKDSGKDCKMYCKILSDTGQTVEITKYRNDSENGNKTFLVVDGDDSLTTTDRRATQKNIEALLGISRGIVFASSIFTRKTQSLVESTESDRKSMLYNSLSLHDYADYCNRTNSKEQELSTEIDNIINTISFVQNDIIEKEKNLESLYEKQSTYEGDKLGKISRLKDEIKKIEEQEVVDVSEYKEEWDRLSKEIIKVDEKLYREWVTKERSLASENAIDTNKRNTLLNQDPGSAVCPALGEYCERLYEKLSIVEENRKKELLLVEHKIDKTLKEIKDINVSIEVVEKIKENNSNTQSSMNKLENKISIAEEKNRGKKEKIDSLHSQIDDLIKSENPYKDLADKVSTAIQKRRSELSKFESDMKYLIEEKKYYTFWVEGFGTKGIPNLKIESSLSLLEDSVNNILSGMKGNYSVSIESQKDLKTGGVVEEISYYIHKPDSKIKSYKSYSEGEKQRIKIADMFSFIDTLGRFNFLFLDEVLDLSLDVVGIDEIVAILKSKEKEYGSILVVSHNQQLQNYFDNRKEIVNKRGVSRIV